MIYQRAVLGKLENLRVKGYSDPFTLRLRQVVTGMLNPGNLHAFNHVMPKLSKNPIVEIGAFCGLSTNLISHFKRKHGIANQVFTCDAWDFGFKGLTDEPIVPGAPVNGVEFGRFVKETFLRNTSVFSGDDLPYPIECFSSDFFKAWELGEEMTDLFGRTVRLGGLISFCFIDGNHDYPYVREDFESVDRFLESGGFILFDDSARFTGSPGPRRLMKELKTSKVFGDRYEVVMTNPHYLVRKH